ncbi:hypothetical protein BKA93DRAFT_830233 [Sparassis latifolia]
MKFAVLSALAIPVVVSAHGVNVVRHHPRQAAPVAAASSALPVASSGSSVASAPAPSSSGSGAVASSASGTVSSRFVSGATTLSFSMASENPTAVPLSDITYSMSSWPTAPLFSTFAPAATNSLISNAPPLPNAALIVPSQYPALDKTPPTDSPQVQQWLSEVMNSGIPIPDLSPTNPGGCGNNSAILGEADRCWWTCGGCTTTTDITTCPTKFNWGLTHDDGPGPYTPGLLQYLEMVNLRTTFFVIGSRVIEYPVTLQTEYMSGHQLCVHTWSHPYMTTLTTEQVVAELGWAKAIIKAIIGVTPLCWRPPYADVDNRVRAIAKALNLETIIWTGVNVGQSNHFTFDTNDWDLPAGLVTPWQVLDNWNNIMGNVSQLDTGFIVLEHDLFQQTVDMSTGYILPDALAHQPQLNITPIHECLGRTLSDVYLETNNNASNPIYVSSYGTSSYSGTAAAQSTSSGGSSKSGQGASGASNTNGATSSMAHYSVVGMSLVSLLAGIGAVLL